MTIKDPSGQHGVHLVVDAHIQGEAAVTIAVYDPQGNRMGTLWSESNINGDFKKRSDGKIDHVVLGYTGETDSVFDYTTAPGYYFKVSAFSQLAEDDDDDDNGVSLVRYPHCDSGVARAS